MNLRLIRLQLFKNILYDLVKMDTNTVQFVFVKKAKLLLLP